MRPILWGIILFIIGMIGKYMLFLVGGIKLELWFFTILYKYSLPVAIIIEIILWIKKRKLKI